MLHLSWVDREQLTRIKHMFPKTRGVARSHDRTVLSGIIRFIRSSLRWRHALAEQALSTFPDFVGKPVVLLYVQDLSLRDMYKATTTARRTLL